LTISALLCRVISTRRTENQKLVKLALARH
jgi:hypothetical protein